MALRNPYRPCHDDESVGDDKDDDNDIGVDVLRKK
jgi:hypothetical protein